MVDLFLGTFFVCIVLLFCVAIAAFMACNFYRRYKHREALLRIRFVAAEDSAASGIKQNDEYALLPADKARTKVTMIYSHDCPEHDACVLALADFLRDNCACEMTLDVECTSEIAKNKLDWACKSLQNADKIIVIHSIGAFYRYQVKLTGNGFLKRADPHLDPNGHLDDLFLMQLDLVNEEFHRAGRQPHNKIISVHFNYTSDVYLMKQLCVQLRYCLPENLSSLVAAVKGNWRCAAALNLPLPTPATTPMATENSVGTIPSDTRTARLHQTVACMHQRKVQMPDWFEASHVRVEPTPAHTSTSPSTSHSTSNKEPVPLRTNPVPTSAQQEASTSVDNVIQDDECDPLMVPSSSTMLTDLAECAVAGDSPGVASAGASEQQHSGQSLPSDQKEHRKQSPNKCADLSPSENASSGQNTITIANGIETRSAESVRSDSGFVTKKAQQKA